MDMFGSDDEDEVTSTTQGNVSVGGSTKEHELQQLGQLLFIEAVKFKPYQKKVLNRDQYGDDEDNELRTEVILQRHIAVISISSKSIGVNIQSRLRTAKFQDVRLIDSLVVSEPEYFDFIAVCEVDKQIITNCLEFVAKYIVPGGQCVITSTQDISIDPSIWINETGCNNDVCVLRLRPIQCNTSAAIYWSQSEENRQRELGLLDEITVSLSVAERSLSILSDASHQKAVAALQNHGVVVFKGIFHVPTISTWGAAAEADMETVIEKLLERGIDFREPKEGQFINNFHEMSMREAFRCDLRNGRETKKLASAAASEAAAISNQKKVGVDSTPLKEIPEGNGSNSISTFTHLRGHPAVYDVLSEVMNPSGGEDARGNWGRYNFEEGGPELGPPPLRIGEVGCVMSIPGCSDQTIHADTPHLYVHTQLPGHYYNLFIPALVRPDQCSLAVGQTAFIAGSHILKTCARMMVGEGGQQILEQNLLRPHLSLGDALIFDCRVLHMGLCNNCFPSNVTNSSASGKVGWRPMLYVNYHQKWFHDPKNWNDAERLLS